MSTTSTPKNTATDDDLLGGAESETTPKVPASAKKPQDRKAKKNPAKEGEISVTVEGLDLIIPEEAFDDFELLDDLSQFESQRNAPRLASILRRLVGDDQFSDVMDHLRDEDSKRVSIEKGADFVFEVLAEANPSS